jgi:hypothetical protein
MLQSREEIKGWSRAKKNALVASFNPKWRDLLQEWEQKYSLDFVVRIPEYGTKPTAKATSKATTGSFAPKPGAQDDKSR